MKNNFDWLKGEFEGVEERKFLRTTEMTWYHLLATAFHRMDHSMLYYFYLLYHHADNTNFSNALELESEHWYIHNSYIVAPVGRGVYKVWLFYQDETNRTPPGKNYGRFWLYVKEFRMVHNGLVLYGRLGSKWQNE